MQFSSYHITGKGRGKGIGFPTINLKIPEKFELADGVYAAIVTIDNILYKGAMHYGPIPVFNEENKSLEIYLLDIDNKSFPEIDDRKIEVDVKQFIREIRNFSSPAELSEQIAKDVDDIGKILSAT
jgi:riboflavin kinase/FMN adenylyltransferase